MLYNRLVEALKASYDPEKIKGEFASSYRVLVGGVLIIVLGAAEGIFAAMMDVQLNNDGPVTILDESDEAAEAEEKEAA